MLYSVSPVRAPGVAVWDCTELRGHGRWCLSAEPALRFPADSSKELEELRSAFARALEHLKQEVEERECAPGPRPPAPAVLPLPVLGLSVRGSLPLCGLFAFSIHSFACVRS